MRTPRPKEKRVPRPQERSVFGGAACDFVYAGPSHLRPRCDLWLTGQSDHAPEHGVCYEVAGASVEWFLSRCVPAGAADLPCRPPDPADSGWEGDLPSPLGPAGWRHVWPLPAGSNALGRWWYAAHERADRMPVISSECFPPPNLVPDPEAFIGLALRRETADGALWLLGLMHEEYERLEVTLDDGTPEWRGFGRGFPFAANVVVRERTLVPETPSPRLSRMHWREPAPETVARPEPFAPLPVSDLPEPLKAAGKWFDKRLLGKRVGAGGRPPWLESADELVTVTRQAREKHPGPMTQAVLETYLFGSAENSDGRLVRAQLTRFNMTWKDLLRRTGGR